ncbi:Uncharacterised protein [Staphylococcus aureus]|nr:Uncharacterised protein [Staphylococcus aureus]
MNAYDAYMKEIAQQMRGELTQNGFYKFRNERSSIGVYEPSKC